MYNIVMLALLLCSCSAIQSADIKERDDEKKDFTAQLALLKAMWRAPDGYTYVTTAKVHDTLYLLVYGRSDEFKIKEVNDKGVSEVLLTDSYCHFCNGVCVFGSAILQLKDSSGLQKSKKKFIFCKRTRAHESHAALTDEKWKNLEVWKKKSKIPKKDWLELFDDQAIVKKSETID